MHDEFMEVIIMTTNVNLLTNGLQSEKGKIRYN